MVVLAKVVASAVVLGGGFRAVSDDDFARVVIAEQWARAPRWDASGTSWLPLPFWITGTAMKIAGRDPTTARVVALALGVVAALLVYRAARWLGETRAAASAGAVAAAVFPWSARLGVATVPELFTAALAVLAMASLAPAQGSARRLLGGAALLAATLSRYETWPVAFVFAGICLVEGMRRPAFPSPAPEQGVLAAPLLGAAALALAGPAVWMAWNRVAHGDALHFLSRVAAYRQALGGGEGSAAGRLWAYPLAMLREEPEIAALCAAAALVTGLSQGAGVLRRRLAPYARPAAVGAAQVLALSLAMMKDGAPTHHPERAVMAELLLLAMAGGALSVRALAAGTPHRARSGLVLAAALALAFGLGRAPRSPQTFAGRDDEEAIGRAAAGLCPPGEPVLIEVSDYGYLAVTAALGRPEDAVPDRSVDPRDARTPSSFSDAATLRDRMAASGARWAAARPGLAARATLGAPVVERGAWALFRAAGAAGEAP
jgi:hypothetical protein